MKTELCVAHKNRPFIRLFCWFWRIKVITVSSHRCTYCHPELKRFTEE
jgi:hypothetical protein